MGDLVKAGKLQLQVKSFMRTNWVDKFCVLHGRGVDQHPYMELYESKDAWESCKKNGKKCDKVIDLHHLKVIKTSSQKTSQGQENLIEIHAKRGKHLLMLKSEEESRDWSVKLNNFVMSMDGERTSSGLAHDPEPDYSDDDGDEECDLSTVNQMYESSDNASRFEVIVEDTDLAKLCEVNGKMTLLVSSSELAFEDPSKRRIMYSFSFQWMRRYGTASKEKFHFEVGRKCPNGPGNVEVQTSAAKEIHKIISKNSHNTSTTKTPKAPDWMNEKKPGQGDPPAVDRSGIGGPSMVANTGRKHPGNKNLPILMPLPAVKSERNGNSPSSPTIVETHLRDSRKGKDNDTDPFSGKLKKELESKMHINEDSSKKSPEKSGSKKSKEDKKREKEQEKEREREAKEREKREKEEKKAKEKEKKSSFGGLFSSKKDKEKEREIERPVQFSRNNEYEEPDLLPRPASKPSKVVSEALYDVADVPTEPRTKSEGYEGDAEILYDEAMSVSRDAPAPAPAGPVEYAQPSVVRKSAPVGKGDVYSDVRDVERSGNAWKQHARKENEEVHTEDYTSIKSARKELAKPPPPIPKRNYDEDEEDDLYDRTTPATQNKGSVNTENVYGTASGPVGDIFSVPSANNASDSEGEDIYDRPDVEEGYETAGNQPGRQVVEAYEDVVTTPKPKPKPSDPYPTETLYEEIDKSLERDLHRTFKTSL